MGFYRSFAGSVQVSVITADVAQFLRQLEGERICANAVHSVDPVTLELTVSRGDLAKLQKLCRRKGYDLQLKKRQGLFWPVRAVLSRPVMVIGLVLLTVLGTTLPGRILFIETDGNEQVPSHHILEQAEECGLKFWSRRREIRSEQIKNQLLESIGQLQWVGVNTYGCRAVITVRERSEPEPEETGSAVSHIVAARDGVIHSCTVTRGQGACTVGQVAREGDILISGYQDCGLIYTAQRAEGKIMAQTQRQITAITPAQCQIQASSGSVSTKYALLIGKKRINFYKGSGISGATCDKMYWKYVLRLPGGFALPVALLKEFTGSCYLMQMKIQNPEMMLKSFASDYLTDRMTDGVIEGRSEAITETDEIFQLTGVYDCLEDIGTVREEKIGEFNG